MRLINAVSAGLILSLGIMNETPAFAELPERAEINRRVLKEVEASDTDQIMISARFLYYLLWEILRAEGFQSKNLHQELLKRFQGEILEFNKISGEKIGLKLKEKEIVFEILIVFTEKGFLMYLNQENGYMPIELPSKGF